MQTGPVEVAVTPGAMVHIMADHTFTVYGLDGKELVAILGPGNDQDRFLKCRIPPEVRRLKIKCGERTKWTISETVRQSQEHPDPTPVEIGIPHERPNTLQEEMKRFIREEVSRHYSEKEGAGTWEEEDDFDIPDEEELTSPYEFTEMQEEMPLADLPPAEPETNNKEDEPGASCPAASVPDSSPPKADENPSPPA